MANGGASLASGMMPLAFRVRSITLVALLISAGACGGDGDKAAGGGVTTLGRDAGAVTTAGGGGAATTIPGGGGGGTTTSRVADVTTTRGGGSGTTTSRVADVTTTRGGGTLATNPRGPDIQLFTLPECSVVPNGALSGADNLTILVAVRNGGPGPMSSLVRVSVRSDSGPRSDSNNTISTGSSFNPLQVDLSISDYNRTHRFTITADPENAVVEHDESNNQVVVSVRLPTRPSRSQDVPCTSP